MNSNTQRAIDYLMHHGYRTECLSSLEAKRDYACFICDEAFSEGINLTETDVIDALENLVD